MFAVRALSQQDPQWKDKKLGSSKDLTIGKFGCLLTSITMVSNGFGYNETPASLDDKMLAAGGFAGGLIRPTLIPNILPGVHYVKRISCNNPPAPLSEIDAALNNGMPVIIKVDASPADGVQDHWIVLVARAGDNDYWVQDTWRFPTEAKLITLTSRYGFGTRGPADIIKDMIFYQGKPVGGPGSAPLTPPPVVVPHQGPVAVPPNALTVYITADSLAFRAQPFVENNILRRLPIQTRLVVLDPPDQAAKKIGVDNEWLFVQDPQHNDQQGYVAAWFVSTSVPAVPTIPPVSPTAPSQSQPPKPEGLIVYASGDNLALRSSPLLGNNLIKRVPMNTQFAVLDPEYSARQKFGQQGQWLKVRDISGSEGYVAAWCLSLYEFVPPLGPVPARPAPTPAPASAPAPAAGLLILRTIVSNLALRTAPIILGSTLIKRLPLSTELLAIDPPNLAAQKIGVVNQWVKVRDIQGAEGYVAAWYVVKSPKSSLTEQTG